MNNEKLLLRQIHPHFIQGSKASVGAFEAGAIAFTPNRNDNGKLSVYNGTKYSPKESFEHYEGFKGKDKTGGVMGVADSECQSLTLPTTEDNDPFDGHSYIDFVGKDDKQQKDCAKELKRIAHLRGWLYRP